MAGEPYFDFYSIRNVAKLALNLSEAQIGLAERRLYTEALRVAKLFTQFLTDINALAVEFCNVADTEIILKIRETAAHNRPQGGDMETHIRSIPGPPGTGTVQVALLAELDKIVNPNGYGPFWRAQEYGTGQSGIPGQAGRVIYGVFEPSGYGPDPSQRGLRVGHDQAFMSGYQTGANLGTISVELPARHFLRDGFDRAGAKYLERVAQLNKIYTARILEISKEIAGGVRDQNAVRVRNVKLSL